MKPREHELKCWPEPFEAVRTDRKLFEYRRDDRGYALGDVLFLREWDPSARIRSSTVSGNVVSGGDYTGRDLRVHVTYILRGQLGVPEGFVVMGIKK